MREGFNFPALLVPLLLLLFLPPSSLPSPPLPFTLFQMIDTQNVGMIPQEE